MFKIGSPLLETPANHWVYILNLVCVSMSCALEIGSDDGYKREDLECPSMTKNNNSPFVLRDHMTK